MSMPDNADGLSNDWLTARHAAAGAVGRARISSVEFESVGEHGMTGHLLRLRLSYDRQEHGAPSSLVAKFSASAPQERAIVHAFFLGGNLHTRDRREQEDRLIATYCSSLREHGVDDYALDQCRLDYRAALLCAATRLATAVGIHPGLHPDPGAFWNVVFPGTHKRWPTTTWLPRVRRWR